jgi:[acyl-carrier-protein] S-malonyltransferase
MGKDLYDRYPGAREVFDTADRVLGESLSTLCFEGPEAELRLTYNTQPALFTMSVACLRLLENEGIRPDVVAGHSVGEYAAVVAAGAISFEDGLRLIRKRAEMMQKASEAHPGTMAAVIGLNADAVRTACERAQEDGIIDVANYNSPGQVVISGETKAVEAASALLKEAGAKRVLPLSVSGAFHSRLMAPAVDELASVLSETPVVNASIPIVANVTANYERTADEIRANLASQIAGSVMAISLDLTASI